MTTAEDKWTLLTRLASYRKLPKWETTVYCTRLAECGYAYTGHGTEVECEGCRIRVSLCETWSETERRLRHQRGCRFRTTDPVELDLNSQAHRVIETDSPREPHSVLPQNNVTLQTDSAARSSQDTRAKDYQTTKDLSLSASAAYTPRASSFTDVFIELIDFPQVFIPEHLGLNSLRELAHNNSDVRKCEKNPGHFAYFYTTTLKLEQIPTQFRSPEMLSVLKVMSHLTVRIVVSSTHGQRRNGNQHKVKVGTGFVIEHPAELKLLSQTGQKSTFNTIKKFVSMSGKKKNVGLVFIQTSRHLVYNGEEALNTTVEFFYDSPDRKDIFSLEGKYLLTNTTPGDSQCLLVCDCSDPKFIERLNQMQLEFFTMTKQLLPLKAKKGLSKKLFMVHHPHGGPKILSYGDYVPVKYKLNTEAANKQATLTKITARDHVVPDVSEYRKTLFYAADTCPGSCGAPILTFCPRQPGANGDVTFKLDIWMHNGVETSHKLGASVLRECLIEDFQKRSPDDQMSRPGEDSDDDEDNLGKQKVNSPVYKVISTPSHPEYTSYQSRLDSFRDWTFGNIMKDEYLATAGFYYTGVSDCVRCFQCGLGLRTWKQGDDVITEHEKYRPTCPYLKSLPKGREDNITGAMANLDATPQARENTLLNLLKLENKTLKKQLTCKVCFKSDIKDVFLPCGELYACSECSKLLTQCPSCGKQILATVTVYLT